MAITPLTSDMIKAARAGMRAEKARLIVDRDVRTATIQHLQNERTAINARISEINSQLAAAAIDLAEVPDTEAGT